jgi:hypothetical protein
MDSELRRFLWVLYWVGFLLLALAAWREGECEHWGPHLPACSAWR